MPCFNLLNLHWSMSWKQPHLILFHKYYLPPTKCDILQRIYEKEINIMATSCFVFTSHTATALLRGFECHSVVGVWIFSGTTHYQACAHVSKILLLTTVHSRWTTRIEHSSYSFSAYQKVKGCQNVWLSSLTDLQDIALKNGHEIIIMVYGNFAIWTFLLGTPTAVHHSINNKEV